jgi:hypothetical protein
MAILTKRKLADLIGPRGPIGADGIPGLDAVPTVTGLAAYVLGAASNVFKSALFLFFGTRIWGTGIDNTGATDSTAAIQAIIDANPGKRLYLPEGFYKISALTLSKGQHLRGAWQSDPRDLTSVFNSAGWATNANFTGTVLRSTLTTGVAITLLDTKVNSGGISDLTIIGPGTGTSTGISAGSSTMSVVNMQVNNVKVGNFYLGVTLRNVNEGSFHDLMIRGCLNAIELALSANQNAFHMLDIQWCGDGLKISADSVSNAFYSHIGQSNSGTALTLSGTKNTFYTPYWENNTVRAVDVLPTAAGCAIRDPFLNGTSDSVRIQAGAADTQLTGFGGYGTSVPITNAGTRTVLEGRFLNLTDTGVDSVIRDPGYGGSANGPGKATTPTPSGLTSGAATAALRVNNDGKRCKGRVEITVTAGPIVGQPAVALPVPQSAPGFIPVEAHLFRAGVGPVRIAGFITAGGSLTFNRIDSTTGAYGAFTTTLPYATAAGDILIANFDYERG